MRRRGTHTTTHRGIEREKEREGEREGEIDTERLNYNVIFQVEEIDI